ncbi:prepilin-type N-terminal cleavage/methylation domain-containing protein [Radiobacillus kanasensis]|uniref:competence type IV pilus minor pilin ComGD n=1 Tax=Radiobacillus kanasensis TaxID=2844358 RepID=UPI001E3B931A|nr:competence type IV pilus minor pilin ComGD [Radiobacillus kanasensis]UFT97768.1 prepilin-type N-terminal cleavage/methylation domain-containing protein [Radiobacillus kanasensis]
MYQLNRNSRGFTLIETIVVLSISISLMVIGHASIIQWKESYETDAFFDVFKSDILYLQQRTMVSGDYYYMLIKPDEHIYEIRKGGYGALVRIRSIPENWEVRLQTLSMPLSFTIKGQVRQPGSFTILTGDESYKVIFPFGKGRSYVVSQS